MRVEGKVSKFDKILFLPIVIKQFVINRSRIRSPERRDFTIFDQTLLDSFSKKLSECVFIPSLVIYTDDKMREMFTLEEDDLGEFIQDFLPSQYAEDIAEFVTNDGITVGDVVSFISKRI